MPKTVKHLIYKFIRNQCSAEELETLRAYFANQDIDESFPEVEDVLEELGENHSKLQKEDSDRIYKEILLKTEPKIKSLKAKKYNKNLLWLLAAIFVGIIGVSTYFGYQQSLETEYTPIITISAQPETQIQLISGDGEVQNLSDVGHKDLTDKTGSLIGSKDDHVLTYHKNRAEKEIITYNTLKVPYGKRFELNLADGSHVVMNAGSSLRYPVNFPREGAREVYLEGEAFFDVSKDPIHPFRVHTDEMSIKVLGTQFNVSAYKDAKDIRNVVLVEGSVDLSPSETAGEAVRLKPGQMASLSRAKNEMGFDIKEVNTANYTAWMKGELVFRNTSFNEMLQRMGRHFNITVINNNQELSEEQFNASFGNRPLEKILTYYKEVYDINYTQKDNTIIVE